ncbi:hypothetical protein [Deinococcus multiflagellatus]|uniref:hypothetical protein n=1 Tax=Deinococcus multiflagellatus TaxID=1656887 RepID=UPI001CCE4B14|nr:hypothetical protein [Deinococcus multiflagellatus]MBZ9712159.1 hypothetical protein [Deinococcus multiflagellatus]
MSGVQVPAQARIKELEEALESVLDEAWDGQTSYVVSGETLRSALDVLRYPILATPAPAAAAEDTEALVNEWRELLIQERVANKSWDSLTEEERRIPFSTAYSREQARISLERRVLNLPAERAKRERVAQAVAPLAQQQAPAAVAGAEAAGVDEYYYLCALTSFYDAVSKAFYNLNCEVNQPAVFVVVSPQQWSEEAAAGLLRAGEYVVKTFGPALPLSFQRVENKHWIGYEVTAFPAQPEPGQAAEGVE